MQTLKEALGDWLDWDQAGFVLAQCTGIMDKSAAFHKEAKHVFWTAHPVGETLMAMLELLVQQDILLVEDETDARVKWNPAYKGSWELTT